MRFMVFVAGAIFAGALSVFMVPSSLFQSGGSSFSSLVDKSGLGDFKNFPIADLNPINFIFDYQRKQTELAIKNGPPPLPRLTIPAPTYQWSSMALQYPRTRGNGGFDPRGYETGQTTNVQVVTPPLR